MRRVLVLTFLALVIAACGDAAVSEEPTDSDDAAVTTEAEEPDETDLTDDEPAEEADAGNDSDSEGGLDIPVDDACLLADAEMVQEVFGGTVAPGYEGPGYACVFEISGGPVEDVRVGEAGPASTFEGVRSGWHDNFEGTTDVPGIGDEAFYPNLIGPLTLIVSAAGQNFTIDADDAFSEAPPGIEEMVADLARAIVARLEG
jgi:hypothetical protein